MERTDPPAADDERVTWLACATCLDVYYLGPGERHIIPPEHEGHIGKGFTCESSATEDEVRATLGMFFSLTPGAGVVARIDRRDDAEG